MFEKGIAAFLVFGFIGVLIWFFLRLSNLHESDDRFKHYLKPVGAGSGLGILVVFINPKAPRDLVRRELRIVIPAIITFVIWMFVIFLSSKYLLLS